MLAVHIRMLCSLNIDGAAPGKMCVHGYICQVLSGGCSYSNTVSATADGARPGGMEAMGYSYEVLVVIGDSHTFLSANQVCMRQVCNVPLYYRSMSCW